MADVEVYGQVALVVPKKGSKAEDYKAFFDRFGDPKNPYRQELLELWSESMAFIGTHQWVKRVQQTSAGYLPRFADVKQGEFEIPITTENEVLPIVVNETSKLQKKRLRGKVRARVKREQVEGGALVGNEILNWHLEDQEWPLTRRDVTWDQVSTGTGVLRSYWDLDYTDLVTVGLPEGALRCTNQGNPGTEMMGRADARPPCGIVLAKADVDPDAVMMMSPDKIPFLSRTDSFDSDEPALTTKFTAERCPVCGSPMEPTVPGPDECEGEDMFGRKLGRQEPKGTARVQAVPIEEMYFENEGIGVTPSTCREFLRVSVQNLDAIREHYPPAKLTELKAEDTKFLIENYPVLGEYSPESSALRGADRKNLFRNHARVREYIKIPPKNGKDLGRWVVMAGNVLVIDSDLCVWTKDEKGRQAKVPRVQYALMRFKKRRGELVGNPITVPLFSPQRRINMIASQVTESRERNVDMIMSTAGMKLRARGRLNGMAGMHLIYDPDSEVKGGAPQFLPARVYDTSVYQEQDRLKSYMKQAVAANDREFDKIPAQTQVPALLIKLLQDEVEQQREEQEQEQRDAFKKAFSHQLALLQRFAREPRDYWVLGEGEQWEERAFKGTDLVGQTDVEIEDEADYDADAYSIEMIVKADQMGIVPKQTPIQQYELRKAMGIAGVVADTQNAQVEDAARKWALFKDSLTVPVVEYTQDDHAIKFDYYGRQLLGDDGVNLKAKAKWDKILPLIGKWQEKLTQAQQLDAQIRQAVQDAQAPPPPEMVPTGDPAADIQQQTNASMAQMQAQAAQQMVQSIPGGPQEAMLPDCLEDQIFVLWSRLIAKNGIALDEFQTKFLKFESVVEAHGMLRAGTMMPAPAAAPPPEQQASPPAMGSAIA